MEKISYYTTEQTTDDNMATNIHSEYVTLVVFPLPSVCMNAPQCYIMCTLSVLLC